MKKMIVVHPEKCYGCLTCVVECAYNKAGAGAHEPLTPEIWSQARIEVEAVGNYAVPLACHHCEDAPCMAVCPTGAISRESDDAPVLLNRDLCIGCRACVLSCPFGMIKMDSTGKAAQKCDLCIDRLKAGEEPVCVTSCPMGALEFKSVEEVREESAKKAAEEALAALESET